jgi:hypothetical protein
MKSFTKFLFTLSIVCLATGINSLNLKSNDQPPKHFVADHSSNPSLHHVVRRNPTVQVKTTESPLIRSSVDNSMMSFGNTSDNNGPNVPAPNYGKTPEIANPAIYVHSNDSLSVIQETPAHVGWRNERKVITSLNKATSTLNHINHF